MITQQRMFYSDKGAQIQKVIAKGIAQYVASQNVNLWNQCVEELHNLFHNDSQKLLEIFGTSQQKGLSSLMVEKNSGIYGVNEQINRVEQVVRFLHLFKNAVLNITTIMMILAAFAFIGIQYLVSKEAIFWIDGVSVFMAVIISAFAAAASNYYKAKQFHKYHCAAEDTNKYNVRRDGRKQIVQRNQIVPGDMILIFEGMEIPADCLLWRAENVIVDESSLTNVKIQREKYEISEFINGNQKNYQSSLMISGTNVISGEGLMIAILVGQKSYAEQQFDLTYEKQNEIRKPTTPTQIQLAKLGSQITHFGILAAVLTFSSLCVRLLAQQITKSVVDYKGALGNICNSLMNVLVITMPDGFPLAIALAFSLKKLYQDKILVKNISACEMMGNLQYICLDKTQILLQNKLKVTQIINIKTLPIQNFTSNHSNKDYFEKIITGIFSNTFDKNQQYSQMQFALLQMIQNKSQIQLIRSIENKSIYQNIYSDQNRRMTNYFKFKKLHILFSTAIDLQILKSCTFIQSCEKSEIIDLTYQIKLKIINQVENFMKKGAKIFTLAYKKNQKQSFIGEQFSTSQMYIESSGSSGFIFLSAFVIQSRLNQQFQQTNVLLKKAGIRPIIFMRKDKQMAVSIAERTGLIKEGDNEKVVDSSSFIQMLENSQLLLKQFTTVNKNQNIHDNAKSLLREKRRRNKLALQKPQYQKVFEYILQNLRVISSCKPEHKFILIDGISKLNHGVGMVSRSNDDIPALIRADIGIGMGITGTQATKDASDIILIEENIKSIVKGVICGKNIPLSVRKFFQFQMTANLSAISISFITAVLLRQTAFAPIQMVWASLAIDNLAVFALATQPPNQQLLFHRKLEKSKDSLFTKTMKKHVIGQFILQQTILIVLVFAGHLFIQQFRDGFDDQIGLDYAAKYYQQNPYSGGYTTVVFIHAFQVRLTQWISMNKRKFRYIIFFEYFSNCLELYKFNINYLEVSIVYALLWMEAITKLMVEQIMKIGSINITIIAVSLPSYIIHLCFSKFSTYFVAERLMINQIY